MMVSRVSLSNLHGQGKHNEENRLNPLTPNLIEITFTNSVRKSNKTQQFSVTKLDRLQQFT
jgi:hypothetical protein